MSRPLRLEYPGALYHVTARGDRRAAIYLDDTDRQIWLQTLGTVCAQFKFVVHSFCQMSNHYHLVVETLEANLGRGMRQLNGLYSQHFNRRHGLVGHVFQGRYNAIIVQKECYLLELARYVVLNPVRAGLVSAAEDWKWSSYCYFMNSEDMPKWLETNWLLSQFAADRASACAAFRDFVSSGAVMQSPLRDVKHQVVLGDDTFMRQHLNETRAFVDEVPRTQRKVLNLSLVEFERLYCTRSEAMARAYRSTAFSMREIATHFHVSPRTVGRAVANWAVKMEDESSESL